MIPPVRDTIACNMSTQKQFARPVGELNAGPRCYLLYACQIEISRVYDPIKNFIDATTTYLIVRSMDLPELVSICHRNSEHLNASSYDLFRCRSDSSLCERIAEQQTRDPILSRRSGRTRRLLFWSHTASKKEQFENLLS